MEQQVFPYFDVKFVLAALSGIMFLAEPVHAKSFNPSLDKVAAVGIGALIAGKVWAKSGLLVVALIF